jgi:hypothetical protein
MDEKTGRSCGQEGSHEKHHLGHMMCEVCGKVGHSGNDCPKTHEEASYINNGFHHRIIMGGTISPAHKEVIRISTQITI